MTRASGSDGRPEKRGRPLRPVPPDFDQRFVELGRAETFAHYRTGDAQIARWLEERGKARLTAKRAAFVKARRELQARERRKQFAWPPKQAKT